MHLLPYPVLILTLRLLLFIESDGRVYLYIYFLFLKSDERFAFSHSHLPKKCAPRSGGVSYPALAQLSAHGILLLCTMFTVNLVHAIQGYRKARLPFCRTRFLDKIV